MQLTRRQALSALGIGLTGPLVACRPQDEPAQPAPVPAAPTRPLLNRVRPVAQPSFGPNGTHWPADAPWLGDLSPRTIDVACDWDAIARALRNISDEDAAMGAHVRVEPGDLFGQGGGARGAAVLRDLGNINWVQRVLVSPRDGYGSVRLMDPVKFSRVHAVAFALFAGEHVTLAACTRSALCWSSLEGWLVLGVAGGPGSITEACDLYEVVVDSPMISRSDPTGFGGGYTRNNGGPADGNGWLRHCLMAGCYISPRWRIDGESDHIDTCQTYSGGGAIYGFTIKDSALFGSTNCAFQCSGHSEAVDQFLPPDAGPHASLLHSLLVGPLTTQRTRYPSLPGAAPVVLNQATNGAGGRLGLVAEDSIIAGSTYPADWVRVNNTRIPSERPEAVALSGGWTVDSTLLAPAPDFFDDFCPQPSASALRALWS